METGGALSKSAEGKVEGENEVKKSRKIVRRKARKNPAAALKKKIRIAIENENYYLAEQLILSQFSRTKNSDMKEAISGLYKGASDLLKAGQGHEGGSLAKSLVEELTEMKKSPTADDIGKLQTLFSLFKKDDHQPRIEFMKAAIEWTTKAGSNPHGDVRLHTDLARYYDRRKEYAPAHKHYVRGSRPIDHARSTIEWAKKGYPSEIDLFIARGVLEYLCVESLKNANAYYQASLKGWLEYMGRSPENRGGTVSSVTNGKTAVSEKEGKGVHQITPESALARTPTLNFLHFLLLTLERDALPLFDMLCKKYKPSIARDPIFLKYLTRIAHIYFGRPAPKGMLEELLSMFG
mmetsp:Transcript_2018/g.2881  ORF Transcript_2018/g.2881 Transcript_2018/m.2881 type:complete len:350 (+) Transcript_2018:31-1080(+)